MNAGSSSDCVLELPPDVVSSDASESREASVELPDPIGAQFACCKNKCVDRFNAAQTAAEQRLKKDLEPLNMEGKNAIWFHQLLNMNKAQPEGQRRKLFWWQGKAICQQAFSRVTQCSEKKIRYYLKCIAEGEVLPPKDGRKVPCKRSEPKREDVESFFCFLYEHLAEPLAISRQDLDEDPAEANACGDIGDSIVDLPDWLSNDDDMLNRLPYMFSGDGSKPQIQKRWLPTMTSAQLHDLYKDIHADHETLASWTTFQRVWVRFQSVMGVRPVTLHSRCDDCARYSASFDFSACCPAVTFSHGPFFYSVTFSWRMIEVWKQELKITCVHWGSQPSINPIILLTRLHVWRCKTARSLSKTSKQSIRSGCRQSCLQQPYPGCLPRQKHHTRDGDHGWKHESFGRCGAATPDGHYRCYGQEQVACTAKSGLIKTLGSFVATSLACCWRSHSWSTWIFCNCRAWCQGRLRFAANSPCPCLRLGRGWTPETRQRHAMESHFPQWQYKQRGAQFSASSFCHCAGVLTALCRSVFGHVPCRTHTQQAGSEIQCDWVFACAGEMLANTRRVCQPFARALSLSSWCPSADRASWRQLPLAQFFLHLWIDTLQAWQVLGAQLMLRMCSELSGVTWSDCVLPKPPFLKMMVLRVTQFFWQSTGFVPRAWVSLQLSYYKVHFHWIFAIFCLCGHLAQLWPKNRWNNLGKLLMSFWHLHGSSSLQLLTS